jgi:colicin import membrane protein/protein TonB
MQKPLPRALKRAIAVSAGAHVLIVVAVVAVTQSSRAQKPRLNVMATQLVRLGKPRPKDLLPRKEEPPPPAPKEAAPVPPKETPKVAPPKDATPVPSAKERLKQLSKVSDALSRLKSEAEEPEGEEDGSVHGTVAKALVQNKFASEIYACMKANYSLEGISPALVASRKATVVVRIDAKGQITDADIEQSSGLDRFDQNVLRAARRCGKVSPPPADLREDARSGIGIIFSGS